MNMTVTNNDVGSVVLKGAEFRDDTFTAAGAVTVAEGTILARNTSTLKLQLYVKGGTTNGDGVPVAIATYEKTAAGAGDIPYRVARKGDFRKERLIIAADGDDSNIDATVIDLLQQAGLLAIDVDELAKLDNQ